MNDLVLRQAITADLTDEARSKLAALAGWPLGKAASRAQREHGWSDRRRRANERGYRQFLALVALYPERQFGMVQGGVDELWHAHLLDTVEYQRMCREVFGQMVHHCPRDEDEPDETAGSAYRETTLPALKRVFGVRPGTTWPANEPASAVSKCCNHLGDVLAA